MTLICGCVATIPSGEPTINSLFISNVRKQILSSYCFELHSSTSSYILVSTVIPRLEENDSKSLTNLKSLLFILQSKKLVVCFFSVYQRSYLLTFIWFELIFNHNFYVVSCNMFWILALALMILWINWWSLRPIPNGKISLSLFVNHNS